MIDKEKLREITDAINKQVTQRYRVEMLEEWLEQNQPVVGLSPIQIVDLVNRLHRYPDDLSIRGVSEWLRDQSFAQPEVKEVVVGLSDEQIADFGAFVYGFDKSAEKLENMLRDWHGRQTFTQPSEAFKAAMEEVSIRDEEIEQLKSQQFTPNWDDAPDGASRCTNSTRWWNRENEYLKTTDSVSFKRPKPTVEVGQVWKYEDSKYQIDSIGKVKMGEWGDCVTYRSLETAKFYTRTMSDFLAKFKRLS